MASLGVFFETIQVGILRQTDLELSFTYAESWLENSERFAISCSLPLDRPIAPRVAGRFFANLLPEANVRTLVCRRLGISEGNDFELLRAIGGECAGALVLLPEGQTPLKLNDRA